MCDAPRKDAEALELLSFLDTCFELLALFLNAAAFRDVPGDAHQADGMPHVVTKYTPVSGVESRRPVCCATAKFRDEVGPVLLRSLDLYLSAASSSGCTNSARSNAPADSARPKNTLGSLE